MTMQLPLFLLLASGAVAYAAPPVLTSLEPWGAQRGKALTVTLTGTGLSQDVQIVSSLPASFTPLTPDSAMSGRQLPFIVELKADIPVGLYPIRVQGPNGLSNILLFSVGTFPEIKESKELTVLKQTPLTINGTLKGPERDQYKIYAKAGERRVFEVEARRMGSPIEPVLRLLNSNAKQLPPTHTPPPLPSNP